MGQTNSHWLWQPDLEKEDPNSGIPKFDPMLGFPNGRKERVMIATQEEMESASLRLDQRDYCAHKWIDYLACNKDHAPFYYKCKPQQHKYKECQHEDYTLRMKEYEREKRLTALYEKHAKAKA